MIKVINTFLAHNVYFPTTVGKYVYRYLIEYVTLGGIVGVDLIYLTWCPIFILYLFY